MAKPWEKYGGAAGTTPGPVTLGTPRPKEPPPVRPVVAETDEVQLARSRSELSQAPADARKAEADARRAELELQALEKKASDPTGALGVEQSKATGFYSRAAKANQAYEALNVGSEPFYKAAARAVLPDMVEPYVMAPEREEAEANTRAFISSVLRYESGAAIPPEEFQSAYRTYFPQPGEDPNTAQAKRRLRAEAIDALKLGSGPGADQVNLATPADSEKPVFSVGTNGGADATLQRTMEPSGGRLEIAKGETQTVKDPALAALNRRVNQMLKDGRPLTEIGKLITAAGVPGHEVARSLYQAGKFRREHPEYKGDWDVRLDESQVPLEGLRKSAAGISASPFGAAGIAAGNVVTGNHLDNLVEMTGGDGDLANVGMEALRAEHPYSSLAGDVAGGVGIYGAGRAVAGQVARRLPQATGALGATNALAPAAIAGDVGLGAYIGSGAGGTQAISGQNAFLGGLTAGAGGIVGRGAINAAGRAISPTGGKLAPLYAEGVEPTLGQRVGGAFGRFEEAHTSLPLLGGIPRSARNQAIDQAQRGAFNQALREIGDELPAGVSKGTQAHAYMQRAFHKVYDQARSGMTVRPDGGFATDFGNVLRTVDLLPPASQNTFKQLAMQVGSRIKERGGALTGGDYKMLSSRINGKIRAIRKNPSGDGELAEALEGFSVALDDAARRHSTPEAAALLDKADRGYVRAVLIEKAASGRGGGGEFSGKALENAIKQGAGGLRARAFLRGDAPMQDYAEAMTKLGDAVPDSGTGPRLAAFLAPGAVGYVAPQALIPSAASLASNLPGIRQGINAAVAPNRRHLAPVRKQIIDRARLGSLFGITLAESQSQ